MIVKDESHVIVETLHNLWSYIHFDTYVISDTGSSDNTKDLIRAFFDEKGVSGELFDDAWLNFGHNRTVAFQHAYNKSDYVFVWDADDRIQGAFKLPEPLAADSYSFSFGQYSRRQLFNNHKRWKYIGVLHECPSCCEEEGREIAVKGDYQFQSNRTGARNKDPLKYQKDGEILEKAYYEAKEANDSIYMRYAYYCANSYNATATHKEKAQEFYKKVLTHDNWAQEKYNSCIELYQMQESPESLHWLVESFKYDSTRIEGIYRLIKHYCIHGLCEVAMAYYSLVQNYYENRYLQDEIQRKLFVKTPEYEFYFPYYMIIVADRVKRRDVGAAMYRILFQKAHIAPNWWTTNLFTNLQFFVEACPTDAEFCYSLIQYASLCPHLTDAHHDTIGKIVDRCRPALSSPVPDHSVFKPSANRLTNPRVLLTVTTCKRWDLFEKTVNSILRTWTDLNLVDAFFCVDDNSSAEDRAAMTTTFPFFEYYMKGPDQKGHRQSMNIIYEKLKEVRPTYWIHMEDDWLFFKRGSYVERAQKALDKYKGQNIHQIVFNKNYGVVYSDMGRTGGRALEPGLHLHIKIDKQPGRHAGFWPHYSLQPSMCLTETILALGNYDSPNKFFERDYANKYFAANYQTMFFDSMNSIHIGKQHWETVGKNAYALNEDTQFNWQNTPVKSENNQDNQNNQIIDTSSSIAEQSWTPVPHPILEGSMADHLESLFSLLRKGYPFALIRPSDGEHSIIKGKTLTNCDKWTFKTGGSLQQDLLEAVQTDASGLYIGIPCTTCQKSWNCTPAIYNDYMALIPPARRTYANIFMNANWPTFVEMLQTLNKSLYVVTSGTYESEELSFKGRHVIDPFLVNSWDQMGPVETQKVLDFVRSKNNAIICFSAGPLSKVWIPKCWALNPTNTYLDTGAALDPFTKGPDVKSRFYIDRSHPFAKESCIFKSPVSGKYLVYACVFYNKDYTELLRLLLVSAKFFSSLHKITFLVLTSKEIEPLILKLAETYHFPILTKTFEYTTIFQAACARLSIFEYEWTYLYEKILYLDTDILIKGDLSTLFQLSLDDKLYGLESGFTDSINFGVQFFDPPIKTSGINSGTLLFRNTYTIQSLFQRIRDHLRTYSKDPPYALDQPFINYHAIKDNLYDNQTLKPYVALFEDGAPENETSAIICHFSFPIGNFGHKNNRMKAYLNKCLNTFMIEDLIHTKENYLLGRRFSWNLGYIEFQDAMHLQTRWGSGTYEYLANDIVMVKWNGYAHVIRFTENTYRGLRTWPNDYDYCFGSLL